MIAAATAGGGSRARRSQSEPEQRRTRSCGRACAGSGRASEARVQVGLRGEGEDQRHQRERRAEARAARIGRHRVGSHRPMLSITTKSPYALRALAELGAHRRRRTGADRRARPPPRHPGPVPRAALRRRCAAPASCSSQRGVKGGYRFAREPSRDHRARGRRAARRPARPRRRGHLRRGRRRRPRRARERRRSPTSSSARTARPARRCTTSSRPGTGRRRAPRTSGDPSPWRAPSLTCENAETVVWFGAANARARNRSHMLGPWPAVEAAR